jgi:hypothetical protein
MDIENWRDLGKQQDEWPEKRTGGLAPFGVMLSVICNTLCIPLHHSDYRYFTSVRSSSIVYQSVLQNAYVVACLVHISTQKSLSPHKC